MKTHLMCFGVIAAISSLPYLAVCWDNQQPLILSIDAGKAEWEIGERTLHRLKITNRSSAKVSIPNFHFLNIKTEDAEIAFYTKEQILQLHVSRGSTPIRINKEWQQVSEKPRLFKVVDIQPGETLSVPFSLTRRCYPSFYSLTEPGEYAVTVTLDTSRTGNNDVLKGHFVSAPAIFRILPVTAFRNQEPHESQIHYAKTKAAFYLERIKDNRGEYFSNVGNILDTPDAVPALIEMLDSKDQETLRAARSILEKIIQHQENVKQPMLPTTKKQWEEWWRVEGTKIPPQKLWSNFDSHFQ